MKKYLPLFMLSFTCVFAKTSIPPLSDFMDIETQRKTGIIKLKQHERMELAKWLQHHTTTCKSSSNESTPVKKDLHIEMNLESGQVIKLNDGSAFQVAPNDVEKASYWIGSIPVKILPSGDPDYPYFLINLNTHVSIKVKKSSVN